MVIQKRIAHRQENSPRLLQPRPLWGGGPRFTSIEIINANTWNLHLDSPCRIDQSRLGEISLSDIMSAGGTGQMEPADAGGDSEPLHLRPVELAALYRQRQPGRGAAGGFLAFDA